MSLIILTSCENDLKPYIQTAPVPIVYGVISPEDTQYRIQLLKSFIGDKPLAEMAKVPDSLYYKQFDAYLELRHLNGQIVLRKKMEFIEGPEQSAGLFGRYPNKFLALNSEELPLDFLVYSSISYGYVCLNIHIWDTDQDVLAIAPIIQKPLIENPKDAMPYPIALYSEVPFQVTWQKDSVYYESKVFFNYELFRNKEWSKQSVILKFTFKPEKIKPQQTLSIYIQGDPFLTTVANKIRDYLPNDIRKFISLDFVVQSVDPAFYQYQTTANADLDVESGAVSNIENGLGIFALTRRTELKGYTLDYKGMDSLILGRFTKHLNFVLW